MQAPPYLDGGLVSALAERPHALGLQILTRGARCTTRATQSALVNVSPPDVQKQSGRPARSLLRRALRRVSLRSNNRTSVALGDMLPNLAAIQQSLNEDVAEEHLGQRVAFSGCEVVLLGFLDIPVSQSIACLVHQASLLD
jgi:hypothetical protein